jgi:hypothetical protein
MLRKIIYSLIILALVLSIVFPSVTVLAEDNKNAKKGLKNIGDESVTSERSKTKLINKVTDKNGKETKTYETTISSLPLYKDDLVTPISASWTRRTDDSGQVIFKSGDNLFTAQITGERITVLDSNGKIHAWTSSIMAGKELLVASNPTITGDLFNPNYASNCVVWNYGQVKKNGAVEDFFLLNNDSATVQRYIRVIEGLIQEYWVLDKDPGVDLLITIKDNKEANTEGVERPIYAYDSEDESVTIKEEFYKTSGRFYLISKKDLKDKVYPIYIDPDVSFSSNSNDGQITAHSHVNYSTVHDLASGETVDTTSNTATVGQTYTNLSGGAKWQIHRSFLYFDTSSIPSGAIIEDAAISLYMTNFGTQTANWYMTVTNGQNTYPHIPLVLADYLYTNYSGTGGWLSSFDMVPVTRNYVLLNPTGISWIKKASSTKLALFSSMDINDVSASEDSDDFVTYCTYEMGTGYQPILEVVYSIVATAPTVTTGSATNIAATSATLAGTLTSDGRGDPNIPEYCSANFEYGITTAYGQSSQILSGYTSGISISIGVTGLAKGTLYYYRVKSTNSAGSSYGAQGTFLTLPDPPYLLSITPGNEENLIEWTKGEGAVNTMVRYRTDTYPTTYSNGTSIYNSTSDNYTHVALTAGTTYYYSLFSWVTAGGYTQYSSTFAYNNGTPYTIAGPTVLTTDATEVGTTTATINGYVSATNQASSTVSLYFEFGTSTGSYGAPVAATPATINYNEYGSCYIAKTGLTNATPYFYRIKAVGTGGTSYGNEKTFTTGGLFAPTITTSTETNVGLTGFTMNGVVTADGGYTDGVTVSFDYGTSGSYGTTTASVTGLSTGDTFYFSLNNLNPSTIYNYRAKGTNTAGTGYGSNESVTTSSPVNPTVTTGDAIDIGSSSASVSGSINNDGGANCEVQFEYGLTTGYGSATGWQSGKTSGSDFTALIEGLNVGDTYHYRAAAKNVTGTSYGNDSTFTTAFDPPGSFSVKAITSTSASFSWTKNGEQTIIVMKKSGFPTDRTDGDRVYFGPDSKTSFSELTGGNTYFFSAWSWRAGDIWTDTYSSDALTMPAIMEGEEAVDYQYNSTLTGDETLYQTNDTAQLQSIPFYDIINDAATDSGIPSATLWFIVGVTLSLVVTCFASSMFGWNAWVFIIVGLLSLWGVSLTTMIPYWVAILSTILAVLYMVKFKGR